MWSWTGIRACSAGLVLALAACGGGGGGDAGSGGTGGTGGTGGAGGTGGTGSSTSATLKFTPSNAGRVAGFPLWASEGLMRLGNALSEDVLAVVQLRDVREVQVAVGWQRHTNDLCRG